MEIIINYDLLKKKGDELVEKASELEIQIEYLLSEIEKLSLSWHSSTGEAYIEMMKEKFVIPLQNLQDVIEKKGQFMISVAKTYALFEEYYYSKKIID